MNLYVEACVDASLAANGASAGIAGEVVCGHDRASLRSVYQYQYHMPIDNIHDAEWAGVLIAACNMNSLDMSRFIRQHGDARYVTATAPQPDRMRRGTQGASDRTSWPRAPLWPPL